MKYLRPHPDSRPINLEGGAAFLGPPLGEQPWHIATHPDDERHPILLLDGRLSAASWESTDTPSGITCGDCAEHQGEPLQKHLYHVAQEDTESYRDDDGKVRTRKGPNHQQKGRSHG